MVLKKIIMIGGLCACVYLSSLSAEENGLYVQGGFEYSNFSGKQIKSETSYTFPKDGQPCFVGNGQPLPGSSTMCIYKGSANIYAYNGNLYGADIQFGYKQFFGNSKHFGLRYYGMFSGQGGISVLLTGVLSIKPLPIFFTAWGLMPFSTSMKGINALLGSLRVWWLVGVLG